MTTTLNGPNGLRIVLDSREIFPSDPGDGTPAMVHYGRHAGTYWCALGEGELACGEYTLTDTQYRCIESQEDVVNEFVSDNR